MNLAPIIYNIFKLFLSDSYDIEDIEKEYTEIHKKWIDDSKTYFSYRVPNDDYKSIDGKRQEFVNGMEKNWFQSVKLKYNLDDNGLMELKNKLHKTIFL